MLRKITEVWQDLIRGWSHNPDEDNSRASCQSTADSIDSTKENHTCRERYRATR